MTHEIQPFNFNQHAVRVLLDDDLNPWFVAKDVCDILGYARAKNGLDRVPVKHKDGALCATLGGMQRMSTVDEAGLYRLVLGSKRPEAEPFIEWVTAEVLPTIRKQGYYSLHQDDKLETLSRENWYLKKELRRDPFIGKLHKYLVAGLNYAECAKLLDVSPSTVSRRVNELCKCGLFRFGGQIKPGITDGKQYGKCCVLPEPGGVQ